MRKRSVVALPGMALTVVVMMAGAVGCFSNESKTLRAPFASLIPDCPRIIFPTGDDGVSNVLDKPTTLGITARDSRQCDADDLYFGMDIITFESEADAAAYFRDVVRSATSNAPEFYVWSIYDSDQTIPAVPEPPYSEMLRLADDLNVMGYQGDVLADGDCCKASDDAFVGVGITFRGGEYVGDFRSVADGPAFWIEAISDFNVDADPLADRLEGLVLQTLRQWHSSLD